MHDDDPRAAREARKTDAPPPRFWREIDWLGVAICVAAAAVSVGLGVAIAAWLP